MQARSRAFGKVLTVPTAVHPYRDKQYDACLATLERRDSIVILPTGAGGARRQ